MKLHLKKMIHFVLFDVPCSERNLSDSGFVLRSTTGRIVWLSCPNLGSYFDFELTINMKSFGLN